MINESNFLLYAAKAYQSPHDSIEEFNDDVARFKYIKRLLNRYQEAGELKERLVLNHIIVVYNVFGPHATQFLFLKLDKPYWPLLVPFLVLLGRLPERIDFIEGLSPIYTSEIPLDSGIVDALRKL